MADPRKLTVAEFKAEFPEIAKRIEPSGFADPVFVYDAAHTVQGDFSIDRYNTPGEAGGYVFLSDLTVTGNLLNWNGDFGIDLVVEGHTTAQNIIAGGSFIHLHTVDVPGVVLGHYNDGYIGASDYAGLLMISDDHHMNMRTTTPYVSIFDFPNSGREIYVDDIKLPYDTRWETTGQAFETFFRDTPWIEAWTDDPAMIDTFIEEGEYSILWQDFARDAIDKGAPARDDSFARLADHMRRAFQAAAADTDPE
ncbi:MAG: hypothetical protein AB8B82_14335 [Roseovarius sp.]